MRSLVQALLPAILAVTPVSAEESAVPAIDPLGAEQLWRTFGSLALLIGLILGAFYLMRRAGSGPRGAGRQIRFVDALALGQRERLVLVQVGDEQIVLGVSPGRVERVHVLEHPVDFDTTAEPGFSGVLRRAVGQTGISDRGIGNAS